MNSPEPEHERIPTSPSEKEIIEYQIAQQLALLKEQVIIVNEKLQKNMQVLSEKQSENRNLKELLAKVETRFVSTENAQSTELNLSKETACASCKSCVLL